jgi:hypothetical protein
MVCGTDMEGKDVGGKDGGPDHRFWDVGEVRSGRAWSRFLGVLAAYLARQ